MACRGWAAIRTSPHLMKTAVRPVRIVRARWRWTASLTMFWRWSVMATKTRPVSAAAPPPTMKKKSCQAEKSVIGREHISATISVCASRRGGDDASHQPELGLINVGRLHRHSQGAHTDAEIIGYASL